MLFVECYADETLMRTLGVQRRDLRHANGKGNVLNRLSRLNAGTGLVDEDSGASQPSELKNYREADQFGGLILMAHRDNSKRRIIVVRPRLEEWLLDRAKAQGVNPSSFGLPDSSDRLHAFPRYDRTPKFPDFLRRLKELDPEMKRLSEWICK